MNNYVIFKKAWQIFSNLAELNQPQLEPKIGRPSACYQKVFFALCRMLLQGCTYRELDRRYSNRSTANKYFLKWARQGLFQLFFECFVQWLHYNTDFEAQFFILDASDLPAQGL